jgi:virulence-associated protein VagC
VTVQLVQMEIFSYFFSARIEQRDKVLIDHFYNTRFRFDVTVFKITLGRANDLSLLKNVYRTFKRGQLRQTTRLFKNENAQSVRIPVELAFENTDIVLRIEGDEDGLRIRPVGRSLAEVLGELHQSDYA